MKYKITPTRIKLVLQTVNALEKAKKKAENFSIPGAGAVKTTEKPVWKKAETAQAAEE